MNKEYEVVMTNAKLFNAKTKEPIMEFPVEELSNISYGYERVEVQENPNLKRCNMCDTLSANCRGVKFNIQPSGFDQEIKFDGCVCDECFSKMKTRSE